MTCKFLTTATAALVLSLGPALAQETVQPQNDLPLTQEPAQEDAAPAAAAGSNLTFLAEQKEGHWLTSSLIGEEIRNQAGETVGEVAAFEIGPDGKVVSVVIDAGGFLGLGVKRIAVPYDAVQHATSEQGDQSMMIGASLDEIDAAPPFLTLAQKLRAEEAERARIEQEQSTPINPAPATGQ